MNAARPIAAVLALLSLTACVTERTTPSRGMRVTPTSPGTSVRSSAPRSSPARPAAPPAMPDGPVATPAITSRSTLSRVEVGVVPLGSVVYDGQTLPLASPDGRFIAVQEGEAPTWEVMLAEPGAQMPVRTGLAVYQIGDDRTVTRVEPSQPLPPGLVLGRAADDEGFLVEAPQANGSRWIGHVSWLGRLRWYVQSPAVNAHATLTPRGELLYSRRAIEAEGCDLVVRTREGQESVRPAEGGSYLYPMCTSDISLVYALRLSEVGIELEAIRLDRLSADGPVRLGGTVFRRAVQPQPDRLTAHQMAATVQPALPARAGVPGGDPTLAILHPRLGRMAALRLDSSAFEPLAPESISAAASRDAARPGFYCTTPDGLVFVPAGERPNKPEVTTVRVLASPYIPRRITGSPESMLLLGPVKGRPDALELVRLIIGPDAAAPPQD